jgi:hypothetical protein
MFAAIVNCKNKIKSAAFHAFMAIPLAHEKFLEHRHNKNLREYW